MEDTRSRKHIEELWIDNHEDTLEFNALLDTFNLGD